MKLSRKQIEKFVEVYEHFHEIEHFTVDVQNDDQVIVSFNLSDVKIEPADKKFVLDETLNK